MRYAFFPGCSMESTARDFRMSMDAVAAALGIELDEIPDWTCCGSTPAHATDELLALSLPARNLAIAAEMGRDVVVGCAACYSRLAGASAAFAEDEALRERVAGEIGRECPADLRVRHFLQVLLEDVGVAEIKGALVRNLDGLRVACYYGCLLTRPRELSIAADPEDPRLMEDLLVAAGAKPVEWPYKTECCGASFAITRTETVERLCGDILTMAKEAGADCLAVACPLCQSNLDLRQDDVARALGGKIDLPVFYFTQLLGLALGISERRLGIGKLMTDASRVLARLA